MKIAVIGCGYVGMASAVVLAKKNEVLCIDILSEKVDDINNRVSPIKDKTIEMAIRGCKGNLKASGNVKDIKDAELIIVASSTSYGNKAKRLIVSSVMNACESALANMKDGAFIVIKSTLPVGCTADISAKLATDKILYSPDFSREGKSVHDNLNTSRIVVGTNGTEKQKEYAQKYIKVLQDAMGEKKAPAYVTGSGEAEAIKLFSNAYLAMRIAFFNELDNFAAEKELNTGDIIEGVCSDVRIGDGYNNPSFGYGGCYLPEDARELGAEFGRNPHRLIDAIDESNEKRKQYIYYEVWDRLRACKGKTIGIYGLTSKDGTYDFRSEVVIDIISSLAEHKSVFNADIIVHEPSYKMKTFMGYLVENDLDEFKKKSDIIVANRTSKELADVKDKVFTRDVYGSYED